MRKTPCPYCKVHVDKQQANFREDENYCPHCKKRIIASLHWFPPPQYFEWAKPYGEHTTGKEG